MKIVVHGQKAFGKELLERLLGNNENVIAVCGAPQKDNEAEDPLIILAKERGIPVFIDKPLTLDLEELKYFTPYMKSNKLMSTSGFRFAKELDNFRNNRIIATKCLPFYNTCA